MAASRAFMKEMQANSEMNMTPMIDVSFLLIIFFICLPMKLLEGKIQAFLPTDKGINPTPTEPPLALKVTVHLLARQERPTKYGPPGAESTVNMPTEIKYKIAGEETSDLRTVADFIKKGYQAIKDTPNAQITGEIKAGHKVPHKFIVAVLNKFAEAGMTKVDFFGTAIPPKELRKQPYLPYPLKNYETTD
jgi:biopolymer transport protein ExbD